MASFFGRLGSFLKDSFEKVGNSLKSSFGGGGAKSAVDSDVEEITRIEKEIAEEVAAERLKEESGLKQNPLSNQTARLVVEVKQDEALEKMSEKDVEEWYQKEYKVKNKENSNLRREERKEFLGNQSNEQNIKNFFRDWDGFVPEYAQKLLDKERREESEIKKKADEPAERDTRKVGFGEERNTTKEVERWDKKLEKDTYLNDTVESKPEVARRGRVGFVTGELQKEISNAVSDIGKHVSPSESGKPQALKNNERATRVRG